MNDPFDLTKLEVLGMTAWNEFDTDRPGGAFIATGYAVVVLLCLCFSGGSNFRKLINDHLDGKAL